MVLECLRDEARGTSSHSERDLLFSQFQPLVRRLLKQYADSPEQRKDLSGEIYRRFHEYFYAYDPSRGVPLRPYLVRQLTASIYSYARGQWLIRRRETSLLDRYDQELGIDCRDPTPQWNDRMDAEALMHTLPDAIEALPARQRAVVIMRYYGEHSFETISSRMGIAPATARSLLCHGCNKLRAKLSSLEEGAGDRGMDDAIQYEEPNMNDTEEEYPGNDERERQVEQGIKGMREAAQRMKEDLVKAPHTANPRQYTYSAIGDAEYAMQGHLERARKSLLGMQFAETGSADHSLAARLHGAETECASYVLTSRDSARERWRLPTD